METQCGQNKRFPYKHLYDTLQALIYATQIGFNALSLFHCMQCLHKMPHGSMQHHQHTLMCNLFYCLPSFFFSLVLCSIHWNHKMQQPVNIFSISLGFFSYRWEHITAINMDPFCVSCTAAEWIDILINQDEANSSPFFLLFFLLYSYRFTSIKLC